jgi:hypothetical protein
MSKTTVEDKNDLRASILPYFLAINMLYGLMHHTTYGWHTYRPLKTISTIANKNIVVEPLRYSSCRASARRKGPPLATITQPVTSADGHHKILPKYRHESISEPSRAYSLPANAIAPVFHPITRV